MFNQLLFAGHGDIMSKCMGKGPPGGRMPPMGQFRDTVTSTMKARLTLLGKQPCCAVPLRVVQHVMLSDQHCVICCSMEAIPDQHQMD